MPDIPKPILDFIVGVATVLGTVAAWLALYPLGRSLLRSLRSSRPGSAELTYLRSLVLDVTSRDRKNRWIDRFYVDLTTELREKGSQYQARIAYYVVRSIHRNLRQQEFDSLTNAEKIDSSRGVTYNSLEGALQNAQGNATVVIGAPGSGKSVSLRNLALKAAQRRLKGKSPLLPIFVDLAHYTRVGADGKPESFENFLETYFLQGGYKTFLANRHWEELLRTSAVIVFLDGLDELPRRPSDFGERACLIEAFTHSWPTCQFVLSCRERDYDRRLSFQQILIKPFDDGQIHKYLKHYFGRSLAGEIERNIRSMPMMTDLCRNPFYLDLVCYFTSLRKSLPRSKSDLFDCIVDAFVRREAAKKGREVSDADLSLFRAVLGLLAYEMAVKRMSSAIELDAYIADRGLSVSEKEVLRDAIEGGLIEHNIESDDVRFQHHRFEEFFCADLIVKDLQTNRWPLPESLFTNLWWRETVLFVAGLADPNSIGIFIDRIIEQRDVLQHRNPTIARALQLDLTILAFECALASSEFSNAVLFRSLQANLFRTYHEGNTLERAQVIEVLRADQSPESIIVLRLALKDQSPWISERAFFALSGGGMRLHMNLRDGFRELCRLFVEGRVLRTFQPFFRISQHSPIIRSLLPLLIFLAAANIVCIALVAYAYFFLARFLLFRLEYAWTVHCLRCLFGTVGAMLLITHFLFSGAGPLQKRLVSVVPMVLLILYLFSLPASLPLFFDLAAIVASVAAYFTYDAFWKKPNESEFSVGGVTFVIAAIFGTSLMYRMWRPSTSPGSQLETKILGALATPIKISFLSAALVFGLGFLLRQAWIFHRLRDCQARLEAALSEPWISESGAVSTMTDLLGRLGAGWAQRILLHRFLMIVNHKPEFSREQTVSMLGTLANSIVDLSLKDAVYQSLEQEWNNFRREIAPVISGGVA